MPPPDTAQSPYALPFVVGVSGHRDPHPDDQAAVGEQLFQALELIAAALPHTPIHCLSALADGADQLFAEQVLRLRRQCAEREDGAHRIELVVPLPMPFDDYCREQAGGEAEARRDPAGFEAGRQAFAARFLRYSAHAGKVFVLPPGGPAGEADAAYAQLTRYLGIHAQLLLAVWDGQSGGEHFPRRPGGTLDLVQALLSGVERNTHRRSRHRFAEPARGNLLHIYSRRAQPTSDGLPAAPAAGGARLLRDGALDGEPAAHWSAPQPSWPGVQAPPWDWWLRTPIRACERWAEHRAWRAAIAQTERRLGRALDPPARAVLYRAHAAGRDIELLNRLHRQALCADSTAARRYADSLDASGAAFLAGLGLDATAGLPDALAPGLAPLLQGFRVADVQAERAKRSWRYRWRFMALAVILASAAPSLRLMSKTHGELFESVVYASGAVCAVGTYLWVALSRQRNAYLDYRALAEGLRCQMYWLCAGEPSLVTDHYGQRASGGMGWVRHALDACMVAPPVAGLSARAVLRGWIDDQRGYLGAPSHRWRRRQHTRAVALGNNMLLSGLLMSVAALATVLIFGRRYMLALVLLLAGMKLATGVGAAWLSLATKMGHGEALSQAEQLGKLYGRADAALARSEAASCSGVEKERNARDLLFALGKAVLEENAGWLAAYQQRRLNWHGR
ncbi:hypothetical protein LPN04_22145 [Rugamonas sp. A1-17]|nr:hypothetical protein [Rugamonas sp. A1-17]